MTMINLVVMVRLYYGFLSTLSIGPSYIFLLRARLMEEGEEGTKKRVSATTGFIAGQLMMFISIYYVPLHSTLGKPHIITVLTLLYLLFHFFWNNHKDFFDHRPPTRNSMHNLSIQCNLEILWLKSLVFYYLLHVIFSILLFITCVYYLGRIPSPILTT
ncbi:hypothetical protein ES319_D10G152900v1 [Gossypium barbadense]|uniref:Translocon at the inner envelope membrane of chloroplasts 214 n=1 Tax=Gossypium barbadense TaxID=3634 RepID=A0A5J5PRM4_GOSBA|nr:hypothetical protein ES319_D10G152900v1 [Gossypium barbadense]